MALEDFISCTQLALTLCDTGNERAAGVLCVANVRWTPGKKYLLIFPAALQGAEVAASGPVSDAAAIRLASQRGRPSFVTFPAIPVAQGGTHAAFKTL